ncbi:MAG: hypothetical protein ABW170_10625 [Candidatus Thiodiazotropha sp. L084R]
MSNKEMSESEPSMTYRNTQIVVRTREAQKLWDKLVRHLITGQAATGI